MQKLKAIKIYGVKINDYETRSAFSLIEDNPGLAVFKTYDGEYYLGKSEPIDYVSPKDTRAFLHGLLSGFLIKCGNEDYKPKSQLIILNDI